MTGLLRKDSHLEEDHARVELVLRQRILERELEGAEVDRHDRHATLLRRYLRPSQQSRCFEAICPRANTCVTSIGFGFRAKRERL